MIRRPGRIAAALAFATGLAAGACATGRRPPPEPVISPTGVVYELGTPPVETRNSQTATLYLRQGRDERALDLALEGIAADPANPIHYYLAGTAYARLGRLAEADGMFARAERIYPAYEMDVEPEREAAWAAAFNAGVEAYDTGDIEGTIAAWADAALIYHRRPEAHQNLASLLATEGRYGEAIEAYQRALAGLDDPPATRVLGDEEVRTRADVRIDIEESLAQLLLLTDRFAEAEPILRRRLARAPGSVEARSDLAAALGGIGRDDEAMAIYTSLLSESGLEARQLFNLGVALFRSSRFPEAAEAFGRLARLQPNSRDAWFNYANSLFAAEDWDELAAAGRHLVELDPLGENSWLITARAHLEIGDREAALRGLDHVEEVPVYVGELRMRSGAETSVAGRVAGNAAEPGTSVRLRFTFYADDGRPMGTERLTVRAPGPGQSVPFDVSFADRASAYRYDVLR